MDSYHIFLFTWKINFLRSLPYGPEREKCSILESNQEIEDKSGTNYPDSLRSLLCSQLKYPGTMNLLLVAS